MKWLCILVFLAIVFDLADGDPLRLRHPNFSAIRQSVRNIAIRIEHSEYLGLVKSAIPKH
jgi:hypothetical protein